MDKNANSEATEPQTPPEKKECRTDKLGLVAVIFLLAPFLLGFLLFSKELPGSMITAAEIICLGIFLAGGILGLKSLEKSGCIVKAAFLLIIFFFLLMFSTFLEGLSYSRTLAQREQGSVNLRDIYDAIQAYIAKEAQFPKDLNVLVQAGLISEKTLQHPADKNPDIDFIVLPFTLSAEGEAIVGCERADFTNGGRAVLLSNGDVVWKEEESFQECLNDPNNKPLAEALQALKQNSKD